MYSTIALLISCSSIALVPVSTGSCAAPARLPSDDDPPTPLDQLGLCGGGGGFCGRLDWGGRGAEIVRARLSRPPPGC